MSEYEKVWLAVRGSAPVDLYGFPHDVAVDPVEVNVDRMLAMFRAGCLDLAEVWSLALQPETLQAVRSLQRTASGGGDLFRIEDELWMKIIFDFARAHRRRRLERSHLLRSLTPLYLARVASFVLETKEMFAGEVEERIEALCVTAERLKPYLESRWLSDSADHAAQSISSQRMPENVEVQL
jgi:hypothetical protein